MMGPPNCVRVAGVLVDIDGNEKPVTLLFEVDSWESVIRQNTRYVKGGIADDAAVFAYQEPVQSESNDQEKVR